MRPSRCERCRTRLGISTVAEDVELGDVILPAGTLIVVNTFAVNRDTTVYDDATRFDISRAEHPPC